MKYSYIIYNFREPIFTSKALFDSEASAAEDASTLCDIWKKIHEEHHGCNYSYKIIEITN